MHIISYNQVYGQVLDKSTRIYRGDDYMIYIILAVLISIFVFILYKIFTIGNSKNEKNVNKVAYKEWEKIEQNRIDDFNDFLKSENYEIISRLDSIPYLPEPHDVELCGDDYL